MIAQNYSKYAIYGVKVRFVPKEYFPESSAGANIRGFSVTSLIDQNLTGTGNTPANILGVQNDD